MKNKKTINITVLVLGIISLGLVLSCDDNDVTNNTESGYYWGGYVRLWTENGSVIQDASGVEIFLEGTNFKTFTDQAGNWKIYNIPAGIYNLVAKKEGYGHHKFIDFDYTGTANSNNFGQTLIATPTYLIDSVELSIANDNIELTGFTSNVVNNIRFVMIYLGKVPPIYDSTETFELIYDAQVYANNNFFFASVNKNFLLNNGFSPGDTLHIAAYPGSRFVERYFLPDKNKLINSSGLGPIPERLSYIIN